MTATLEMVSGFARPFLSVKTFAALEDPTTWLVKVPVAGVRETV